MKELDNAAFDCRLFMASTLISEYRWIMLPALLSAMQVYEETLQAKS